MEFFWGAVKRCFPVLFGAVSWPFACAFNFFSRRSGAGGRRARESLVLAGFVGCLMVPCCSAAAALSLLLSSALLGLAAWLHP